MDFKGNLFKLLELTQEFKYIRKTSRDLAGKSIGLLFEKPSTRTRVSFEVAIYQLGGSPIYMSKSELQLERGESLKDTAIVLSKYLDAVVIRAMRHKDVVYFAENSTLHVINGLTDLEHPCQALSDLFTIQEKKGLKDIKVAYFGDGNNVCNSLMLICAMAGIDIWVASPERYSPKKKYVKMAKDLSMNNSSEVVVTEDVKEAAKNADVIYTDVWVSMGNEEEREERERILKEYQVNSELISFSKKDAIIMHCLPAIRGKEITEEVMYGKNSVIFEQAENRLYGEKAILYFLMR